VDLDFDRIADAIDALRVELGGLDVALDDGDLVGDDAYLAESALCHRGPDFFDAVQFGRYGSIDIR
jgi:hypothetical protein